MRGILSCFTSCIRVIFIVLMIWLLWNPTRGTFVKEMIFIGKNITEPEINVTVHCHVQGNLRWFYTDDHHISISVRVTGDSLYHINSTDVDFESSQSTVNLHIRHIVRFEEAAAVTGTGNQPKLALPMLLLFALMAAVHGHVRLSLLLLATGSLSQSSARDMDEQETRHRGFVDIEIRAPRRFRYKNVNLLMTGGSVRVKQGGDVMRMNTTVCRTTLQSRGCPACCSSRGTCVDNQCHCDRGYEPSTGCSTRVRQDVLFEHPLDPRLSSTVLPTGDVMTLYKESLTSSNVSPTGIYMDMVPNHKRFDLIQFAFHSGGFLRRLQYHSNGKSQIFILRRHKRSNCLLTLSVPSKTHVQVNICNYKIGEKVYKSTDDVIISSETNSILSVKRSRRLPDQRSLSAAISVSNNARPYPLTYGIHFVDVPVKEYKCGKTVPLLKPVSFQLQPTETGNAGNFLYKQSVTLHTHTVSGYEGTFLRLPNISQDLEVEMVSGKCQYVLSTRANICIRSHFQIYDIVCNVLHDRVELDVIDNNSDSDTPADMLSEYEFICQYIIPHLRAFCDRHNVKHPNKDCQSDFTGTSNLFKHDQFSIRPVEQSLNGKDHVRISPSIISIKNLALSSEPEIVIRDNTPAFKIVGISVIPQDPRPSDIYQVRLDYECATNATVIRMNVTGSDKYTNHVTCTGVTECHCCILHAAGAANAVVDHVFINIYDTLTKLELNKEMVVIF